MITLRIEHAVRDFDKWRQAFDSDPVDRKGAGVRRYRVFRAVDDPSWVMIDLDLDTRSQADALLARLEQLWSGPARAVMQNPRARLCENVEASEV